MPPSKNILILYITERSGHHHAALALQKAFLSIDPSARVTCVNGFRYIFPVAERLIHKTYLFVIKRMPFIWRNMYDQPRFFRSTDRIKHWIHRRAVGRIKNLLEQTRPDAVLCTQAFPCGLFAFYKKEYASVYKLYGVLTDFAPHAYWVHDEADGYIVGSDQTRHWLAEKGVPADRIHTFGIPIDPKFSRSLDVAEVKANYGLEQDVPVVLIMGGGHGLGPIKKVLKSLDESCLKLQLIVVCGINEKLYRWLLRQRFQRRMLAFRYTDQIDRLMSAASLIVTKPGGITTAEALAKQLPMVILHPIPGQEKRNTDFLVSQQAALSADGVSDIVPAVEKILSHASSAQRMKEAIVNAGLNKPTSAQQTARFVLERL